MAPAPARTPKAPRASAASSAPPAERRIGRTGTAVLAAIAVAFFVGFLVAPRGHGGLVLETDRGRNLWALVPTGWKDSDSVAPYGTELDSWFDPTDPATSETILAVRPARASPQQRAIARAAVLAPLKGYQRSYLGPVTFPGGRAAYLLQYSLGGTYTGVFEFDACQGPPIAVTVTVDAPSASRLSSEENALPEGAEPVCNGDAFTSPDRANLAVPLRLPS